MFRKQILTLVIFALLFVFVPFSPGASGAELNEEYVPGDILVVFKAPLSSQALTSENLESGVFSDYLSSAAGDVGASLAETYSELSEVGGGIFARLKTQEGSEKNMLEILRQRPDVLGVQLNYRHSIDPGAGNIEVSAISSAAGTIPNDTKYSSLWGMPVVKAPEAWSRETGSRNVYVAVIDSGIDYTHADLKDNFETDGYSANYSTGTEEGDYSDGNGHGTHVAGTIGAIGNNGMGVAGVSWKTKLISLRIFNASGGCGSSEIMNAVNGLLKLLKDNEGLKIASVNMSYGYTFLSSSKPESFKNDPEYLAYLALSKTNRIVLCVAAGNHGAEIGNGLYAYPASFTSLDNMITVANAQNSTNYPRSYSSNYSKKFVDIAAPGTNILSTAPQSSTLNDSYPGSVETENGYKYLTISGTSMATPHVAGAVALLAAAYPDAEANDLKAAILNGANKNYATDYTANGFLDVNGALDILEDQFAEDTPPAIRTTSLPAAYKTVSYSAFLSAKGTRPLKWSIISGTLPDGLAMNQDGKITGTPTKTGTSEISVKVSNNFGTASAKLSITVEEHPDSPTLAINSVNFPDSKFRSYVSGFDKNKDGYFSKNELLAVKSIYVYNMSITDMKGIEHFTEITSLNCSYNKLVSLDVSRNTALDSLYCYSNQITALDVSKNTKLTYLYCGYNKLAALNVSRNTALTYLSCYSNQITALDVSRNTKLTYLYCGYNKLSAIDVSKNTALDSLYCYSNQITALDVSKNIALSTLSCYGNKLAALDVSRNTALTYLSCYSNQITALDVSRNTKLTHLDCENNKLTAIDVSKNTALTTLWVNRNQLTVLDVSKNISLQNLYCGNNKFTALDVSKNTALTYLSCYSNQITALDVSKNTLLSTLECGNNQLTAVDVSKNTALTYLSCYSNQITALDVSRNKALTSLSCSDNQLTALNVSKNTALATLECGSNKLTDIDLSRNIALKSLYCYNNQIAALDLTANKKLSYASLYGQKKDGLKASESYNSGYPYVFRLAELVQEDMLRGINKSSIRAYNSGGMGTDYEFNSDGTIYFASKPSYMYYYYKTGYANEGSGMYVTLNFSSSLRQDKPEITSDVLKGDPGKNFTSQLKANGMKPVTWKISAGSLPGTLSMSASGDISGTMPTAGVYHVTVKASNPAGSSEKKIAIVSGTSEKPVIITDSLPPTKIGAWYSAAVAATGDTPIKWTIEGKLPSGLSFVSGDESALIEGAAEERGTFTVTVKAENKVSSASRKFTIRVTGLHDIPPSSYKFNVDYISDASLAGGKSSYGCASLNGIGLSLSGISSGASSYVRNQSGKIMREDLISRAAEDSDVYRYSGAFTIESGYYGYRYGEKGHVGSYESRKFDLVGDSEGWYYHIADPEDEKGGPVTFYGGADDAFSGRNFYWTVPGFSTTYTYLSLRSVSSQLNTAVPYVEFGGLDSSGKYTSLNWRFVKSSKPSEAVSTGLKGVLSIQVKTEDGSFYALSDYNVSSSNKHFGTAALENSVAPGKIEAVFAIFTADNVNYIWCFTPMTPPAIITETLDDAEKGEKYLSTIEAEGSLPMMWRLTAGSLPAGLSFTSSGDTVSISGTPSAKGSYKFTFTVSNDAGTSSRNFTLSVESNGLLEPSFTLNLDSLTISSFRKGKTIYDVPRNDIYDGSADIMLFLEENEETDSLSVSAAGKHFRHIERRTQRKSASAGDDSGGFIRDAFTISAGSGTYKLSSGNTIGQWDKTFGLADDGSGILEVAETSDESLSFMGGADYAFKHRTFKWAFTPKGCASISGTQKMSGLRSVREQMSYAVPYVELTKPNTAGKYTAAVWRLVRADNASLKTAPGFDAVLTIKVKDEYIVSDLSIGANETAGGEVTLSKPLALKDIRDIRAELSGGGIIYEWLFYSLVYPPEIATEKLNGGEINVPYDFTLTASGDEAITWTAAGKLPSGLNFDGAKGRIYGTPSEYGIFGLTFTAENSAGKDTKSLELNIAGNPPVIISNDIRNVYRQKSYRSRLGAKGSPEIIWRVLSGQLPPGMSLSESGILSGTPTRNGTFKVTLQASNTVDTCAMDYVIKVGKEPEIKKTQLRDGTDGKKYNAAITFSATKPVTWSIISGRLPSGLSLNTSTGKITGTPAETGKFTFRARLEDSIGRCEKDITLTIKAVKPVIKTPKLPKGQAGEYYEYTFEISKGTTPVTWSASGLPSGLTLDPSTGKISGIPTDAFKKNIAVTAKNSAGTSAAKRPRLQISGIKPVITDEEIPAAVAGSSYSYQMSAKGSAVLKWSWSGKKPSGLKINASGLISGTPTKAGDYSVIITVKNAAGNDKRAFTFTVRSNNAALPDNNTDENSGNENVIGESFARSFSGKQETTAQTQANDDNMITLSGQDYIIVAVLPEVSVDVEGQYDFGVELGEYVPEGAKLFWFAFHDGESSEDDEIADFYDENGKEIDSVPESRIITVSPWLNPGIIYRPVIAVEAK